MSDGRIRRWLSLPERASRMQREVDDELAFHLASRVAELEQRGWSPAAARAEAEREFGDLAAARAELVAVDRDRLSRRRWRAWGDAVRGDLQQGWRVMRREPGFTLAVVSTLAIGIGANATMFGIVDRLLFRAPPHVREAATLRHIGVAQVWNGQTYVGVQRSFPEYLALERENRSFASLAASWRSERSLGRGAEARTVPVLAVTASYFPLTGARPVRGRFFAADEDRIGRGAPVAVLSHGFWKGAMGGAEGVVGQSIEIHGRSFTVIGVAPPAFRGLGSEPVDLFVPMSVMAQSAIDEHFESAAGFYFASMDGRLKPGVSDTVAAAEVTAIIRRVGEENAADTTATAVLSSVIPGRNPRTPREYRVALWLQGVAVLLLVIACANVANLMLTRAERRRRERAVRLALGVSRWRLTQALAVETLMLALLAVGAALVVAQWGGDAIRTLLLPEFAAEDRFVDARVVAVAIVLAMMAAAGSALVPALRVGGRDLTVSLKDGARDGTYRRSTLRTSLVAVQAALSMVLLVGTALFVRSLQLATAVDLGFDTGRVAYLYLDTSPMQLDTEGQRAFVARALERVRQLPGVESASRSSAIPFSSNRVMPVAIAGRDSLRPPPDGGPYYHLVDPSYFSTMGVRLRAGRLLDVQDVAGAPPVAVINESFARRYFAGTAALGQCLILGADGPPCTQVVGVVADARRATIRDESSVQYYLPVAQGAFTRAQSGTILLRAHASPDALLVPARRAIQSLAADAPAAHAGTLRTLIEPELRPWRLGATLFTIFGALALLVAGIGLFGVVSYDTAQRSREIGLRLALGASGRDVLRLVLRTGTASAALGGAAGLGIALAVSGSLAPLLFHVSPRDPRVLGGALAVLCAVAAIASALPAWRATRIAPSEALRGE
ncbi:MAG: ABC transporter permease [Gemmatimonadaceae bacterium]|jgi:putative ABC transport system permease protein|nr:ABC transporter permease [Gemmatimonadaceae bacterium]